MNNNNDSPTHQSPLTDPTLAPAEASRDGDTPPQTAQAFIDITKPPFNAVGDGVTDDSAAIQAAVDWMAKNCPLAPDGNRGGVVQFPIETFALGDTVQIPSDRDIKLHG